MTKKDTVTNKHGLGIEIEIKFVEKDDFGNTVNDWCIDQYNTAKLLVYKDRKCLLPADEEKREIAHLLTTHMQSLFNSKGGQA